MLGKKTKTALPLIATAGAASIYRNPGLPRARLMGRPYYAADEPSAIQGLDLLAGAIRDRVVVEDPDRPLPLGTPPPSGEAKIVVDDPEHVEVQTSADGPCYLTLSDAFDPGWTAAVDGRPAPIRPAWIAFRAVYLTKGDHRLVFRYVPAGFTTGLAISSAGLALALVLLVWPWRLWPWHLPRLDLEHGDNRWPRRWPAWGIAAIALLVLISLVDIGPGGTITPSVRWRESFHEFTWGAGIQAMK